MNLAALAGRTLDIRLLSALAHSDTLDSWLERCAAVFEINGGVWRFAHDKLREGVIASIAIPERPGLHRLIAETIEMLYEDNPDYTLPLALHWREAGDEARDMHYSSLAGSQILRQGIVSEAVSLLERAHRLGQRLPHDDLWYARLCHSLTEATIAIGRPQQSFAYLLEAIKTLKVPTLPPAATVDEVLSRPIAIDLSGFRRSTP